MFQVLCKKYVGERVYDPPPEPETTDAKAEDENKEEGREENKNGENTDASESMSKEEVKESKHEESKDTDSLPAEAATEDQSVVDAIDHGKDEMAAAVETGVQGIKALPKINDTQSSNRDNLSEQSDRNTLVDNPKHEKSESKSESDKENQQNHVTAGKRKRSREASVDDGAKTSKKSARTISVEIDLHKKPLLTLTPAEVRKRFGLTRDLYVKIKKNKVLYKFYLAQMKRLGLPLPEKSNEVKSSKSSPTSEDNSMPDKTSAGPDNKDIKPIKPLYEPDQDKPSTSKVNAKPFSNCDDKPIVNNAAVEDIKNKVNNENQYKSRSKSPMTAKSRTESGNSSRSRSRSRSRNRSRSSLRSGSRSLSRSRLSSCSSPRSRSSSRSVSRSRSRSKTKSRSKSRI